MDTDTDLYAGFNANALKKRERKSDGGKKQKQKSYAAAESSKTYGSH